MFKTINKLKKDKRGFTLTEVLVTMTILMIALALMSNLVLMFIRNYRAVEYKWTAQTMAEYLASSLTADSGLEALGTANVCEIMYEAPASADDGTYTFESCPELGTATYNSSDFSLTFTPSDTYKTTLEKGYIYYITFGDHLYRIHYSDLLDLTDPDAITIKSAVIKPISEDMNVTDPNEMDAEIKIEFAIARSAGEWDDTTHAEDFDTAEKYLDTGLTANVSVNVVNKGDARVNGNADMNVSLYMNNMIDGRRINYDGTHLINAYVCGWTKNDSGEFVDEDTHPDATVATDAGTSLDNIARSANIVRYHSVNTPLDLSDTTTDSSMSMNTSLSLCYFKIMMGGNNAVKTLEPLRDFRDQILRGNAAGEWIIEKYYEWSPALISFTGDSAILKGAGRAVTKGLAAFATVVVE